MQRSARDILAAFGGLVAFVVLVMLAVWWIRPSVGRAPAAEIRPLAVAEPWTGEADEPIDIALTEWPPYTGDGLENYGFMAEIVTEALEREGLTVRFTVLPWTRALKKVAEQRWDATVPAYITGERAETYAFSEPVPAGSLGFYARTEDRIQFDAVSDLEGKVLGVGRNYVNGPEIDDNPRLIKEPGEDDLENMQKLARKRVDLVVVDQFVGAYLLRKHLPEYLQAIEFLPMPKDKLPMHMLVSQTHPQRDAILGAFNRGLDKLDADGTVVQILQRWNLPVADLKPAPAPEEPSR